ncbi:MAG TPA: NAD-dependent epimerase/dehydratase family protein, partial [Chloroflexia bacterium]|nr:NAD-dependent epimerase/dehydratase family protein [Chloroflexia bacterium]
GGAVARQLLDRGHKVVTIARDMSRAVEIEKLGVEVSQGDITDMESMREPMRGADGVFHIAAWYKVGADDSHLAEGINVGGTRNVLELMRELGIPKGVYTSTLAVFSDTKGRLVDENYYHAGPWLSEYDRTKWLAHYKVALPMIGEGLPLVIVQPGMIYGPGDQGPAHQLWEQYLQRRLPMVPAGAAYCWGFIDDMAEAHILAMEKGRPGRTYIIAGPPQYVSRVLHMAEETTGVPAPKIKVPAFALKGSARLMEQVERFAKLPAFFRAETMRSMAGVTYLGTNNRARRELGIKPRAIREGLRVTMLWEMQQMGIEIPPTPS